MDEKKYHEENKALQQMHKEGLKPGCDIPEILKPLMQVVEESMQHMFGGAKPFREHSYYVTDVFPRFNRELQLHAELLLMQRGVLPVEKHNIVANFCNGRGNHWEAAWMEEHMKRNYKNDCEVVRVADRLVVSVSTLDPEKQLDIRENLTCSWAQKGVYRMPYEPIKEMGRYILTGNGQVVKGYITCNQFTENNYRMALKGAEGSTQWGWIHPHGGAKYESLQTEEKIQFKDDNRISIEKIMPADEIDRNLSRISNATVYSNSKGNMNIRCKIDGGQQMGVPLNWSDSMIVKTVYENEKLFGKENMDKNIENYHKLIHILACEYFSENLKTEMEKTTQRTR